MKLEISLYKFDAKSDYLPYYTKHFIKPKNEKNLLDILETIYKDAPFGFEKNKNFGVVVNGLYTTLDLTLEQIKKDFGSDLLIEPLSTSRAYKDLLINDDAFYDKLSLLYDEVTDDVKKVYENYKLYYYASNSLKINKNYIGDALVLLAASLLEKGANKDKINSVLLDEKNGIHFHTNLSNKVYNFDAQIETTIKSLQAALNVSKALSDQVFKTSNAKTIKFEKEIEASSIQHSFKDFNIAYYKGLQTCEKTQSLLNNLEAKQLLLPTLTNDLAMDTFHANPYLTYTLVAEMMLDAFDNDADFIVVDNMEAFYLLDSNRKELEKVSGREVHVPIIHTNELAQLAYGFHDDVKKSLAQHSVNPQLI